MTLFFGDYRKCRCIAHVANEAEAYDKVRQFLSERKIKQPTLKTWSSPEKIKTINVVGATQEFYLITKDVDLPDQWKLTKDINYVSMEKYEIVS